METKQKLTNGFKGPKIISSTEKKCNKCGFVTFSLHILYSHQYKCRGTLLNSMVCCHCKRKFSRLVLFRQHKKTCLKNLRKVKTLGKIFAKKRLKASALIGKQGNGQKKATSIPPTIACPKCKKQFMSKMEQKVHLQKGSCSAKSLPVKEIRSARKSFSKPDGASTTKTDNRQVDADISMDMLPEEIQESNSNTGLSCAWCKNVYPNEEILSKHLERNPQCALALNSSERQEVHTARKSLQHNARKSFPNHKHSPRFNSDRMSGSARKSLPNSSRRFSPLKSLNQCPVCYKKIPDPFKFFQHQKKLNHWGKATKSMNNTCKCPFCAKQFIHAHTFNAHVRNHADISEKEKEYFLKKTTCNICAQIFASETAKFQHLRIFHSKSAFNPSSKRNNSSNFYEQEHSQLPLALKQKLRMHPNSCPICAKEFAGVRLRNEHFQTRHIDCELECKFCPRKFNELDNLESHMQDEHYDSFEYECVVCRIHLATAPHVVLHCTKLHSNQDPKNFIRSRIDESVVTAPGFEYSMPEQSTSRARDNSFDGYYCDICKMSFAKKAGLQIHRQSKSHKDTVVKNLDSMRESIADLPSPKKTPKVAKKIPKILTCTECLEDFTSVKDFVPHRLGHFGRGKYMRINELNLYTCEICGDVSNSHSKVQMHLFWHLQVDSTSPENIRAQDRADSVVSDRLSGGQQVAKKSFGNPQDSQQEIVIGGVKKSLFTCEKCNISFTTEGHYNLHVRKLCKNKVAEETGKQKSEALRDDDDSLASNSKLTKSSVKIDKRNVKYCTTCNTLYDVSVKEVHSKFCEKCAQDTSGVKKIVTEQIKSDMVRRCKVATCVPCGQLFSDSDAFSKHMLDRHVEISLSDENETDEITGTVLCTTCNCLFLSSSLQKPHEAFCEKAVYHNFDEESSKEILKPFPKLGRAKAVCITCSVLIGNVTILKKHVLQHKDGKKSTLNGPNSGEEVVELEEDIPKKAEASTPEALQEDDSDEALTSLRGNFSQLFCLLINDAELMQQLGYDELPVDEVLVSVLQQMGQETVLKDETISDINCLRKNIRIFLDFCLKDQIMELIESGKTSIDDIVVEALKTLTNDEGNAIEDA